MDNELDQEVNRLHRRYFASIDKDKIVAAHRAAERVYLDANEALNTAEESVRKAKGTLNEARLAFEALDAILMEIPNA